MTAGGAGQRIGPYVVVRELGSGGMGRVVLARSPGGNLVAVKLLRAELAASAEYRRRFAAEVAAARAVVGVFTAPVVDADPAGPEPWLATAYVPGPTLDALVRAAGAMDETALRALAAGLAEALTAIHAAGVVHRDLKPGNVLMSAQGPRVIDFGISKDLAFGDEEPVPLGSVGYAAPEQVTLDHPVGQPCDVFALGAVLAFAASARPPFGDVSPEAYAYRVLHEEPDLGAVPDSMRQTVAACMSKNPAHRPTPAEALAALAPPAWQPARTELMTEQLTGQMTARLTEVATLIDPPWTVDSATRAWYPRYRRRLARRDVLGIAGAVVAVAGTGVGLAAALGGGTRPGADGAATPSASGTTFGESVAALPKGPPPLWATTPDSPPNSSEFWAIVQVLGTAVLWYPIISVDLNGMLGFDAATGRQLWSGISNAPSLGSQVLNLSTVAGSTLYGSASDGLAAPHTSLFGLDASGRQTHSQPLPAGAGLWGVWGDVALVSLSGGTAAAQPSPPPLPYDGNLAALSLSDGSLLWSAYADVNSLSPMTADAAACYYQDKTYTYAYDMRSGVQKWRVRTPMGTPGPLNLTDSTLIVSAGYGGLGVSGLDPATGNQVWSTTQYSVIAIHGSRVYGKSAVTQSPTSPRQIVALDAASGRVLWTFDSPVSPSATVSIAIGRVGAEQNWASDEILAFPYDTLTALPGGTTPGTGKGESGFIVLEAATGKPIWAHAGSPDAQDTRLNWQATVSGDTVYAASATTLYAFKAGS